MARTTRQVSPSAAMGAPVGRTRSASANASSRRRGDARAELRRRLEEMPVDLATPPEADGPAIRYLESSRMLARQAPAELSSADQIKLVETQADRIVGVISAVLDGLRLSDEDWERGRKLAAEALRAVAAEGWSPL